jgi:hypothetical protein
MKHVSQNPPRDDATSKTTIIHTLGRRIRTIALDVVSAIMGGAYLSAKNGAVLSNLLSGSCDCADKGIELFALVVWRKVLGIHINGWRALLFNRSWAHDG